MGYDASCEVRLDGQTLRGTAVLEQSTLLLRGPVRLSIPLQAVTSATAEDGWLTVRFDGRSAQFALGAAAAKWAARIANPPSRLDKLGVKAGMQVLVLGPVDDAFLDELAAAVATVARRASPRQADLVFYVLEGPDSFDRLTTLAAAIVPAGAIWTLRVKGSPLVTEAATLAAGRAAGLVDVKVVSFSAAMTAEKFVIPVALRPGARAGRPAPGRTPGRADRRTG